jgi:hypothetical protein
MDVIWSIHAAGLLLDAFDSTMKVGIACIEVRGSTYKKSPEQIRAFSGEVPFWRGRDWEFG